MELMNLLAFTVVATLLVVSPGPNGVLIAKTVPVSGKKAGLINVLGFVAAFYVHGTLSIFGISIILVQSAQAFFIFKILGASYLCWIGIKSLYSAWNAKSDTPVSCTNKHQAVSGKTSFLEGFLTNVLNPKVSMFYLAAFPQFISIGESVLSAYSLVTIHAAINLIWFSLLVYLLAQLNSFTSSQLFSKWLKSFTGVVFIGFGAKLALLKPLNNS